MKKLFSLSLILTSLIAQEKTDKNDFAFRKAMQIAQETIIVDGHVDIPYRLNAHPEDISVLTKDGHFDYQRAKLGGLNAPFMSIYVGAKHQKKGEGSKAKKSGDAYKIAKDRIRLVNNLVRTYPNHFAIARSPKEIRTQFMRGLISLPMGMENGAPIEGSLDKLREFYKDGIRYITLTHSEWNHICDSSYDKDKHWNGLSPFGKTVVAEMNKLGIMIDVSHVSDSTFYDVMKLTKAPVIASHSSCRHFTPGMERNMGDDMIRKLAENNGIIMINFGSFFIIKESQHYDKFIKEKVKEAVSKRGGKVSKKIRKKIETAIKERYPKPYGTVQDVADHIDHVKNLVGVDYIGFGSDFDGVGSLPEGLKNASMYPFLFEELLKRGYSESDLKKMSSGNIFRVWEEVEKVAKR